MKKPRWKPTEQQVKEIRSMATIGLTEKQICTILGVSEDTFQRAQKKDTALRAVILKGREEGDGKVQQTLFQMATSGNNTAATIFWMKVRCRWKETNVLEHTGKDGGPIEATRETESEKKVRLDAKLEKLRLMFPE